MNHTFYQRWGKRLFDLSLLLPSLIFLLPFLALITMGAYFLSGIPVFFCQDRPGFKGRSFRMYKFRTMTNQMDGRGIPLPDAERLTSFGRFLRSASLDELPELFNILKGEMSLVGPRPLLLEYLPLYTPEQARRHEVTPGITGWAQVNGRNAITWEEKFKLDVWYVDHQSFFLDLKILGMTLGKVLKREGINEAGQATMRKFDPRRET